jgi:hypothetical protein
VAGHLYSIDVVAIHMDEIINKHQLTEGLEGTSDVDAALESPSPNASYLRIVNNVRLAVAILMVICGPIFAYCIRQDDFLRNALRRESGIWGSGIWVFGIGVLICMIATFALIIEKLARPVTSKPIRFRPFFVRAMLIAIAVAVIYYSMDVTYGLAQGIGATIGTLLLLGALKNNNPARAVLAVLAVIVLGPTLLSTQSAYQYARRHTEEIVAAGCELMDKYPETQLIEKASLNRQQLPAAIRKLGAYSIKIDKEEESVSIYVPGAPFIPGNRDCEFHIFRNPATTSNCVWVQSTGKGGGTSVITDKLWMFEDN